VIFVGAATEHVLAADLRVSGFINSCAGELPKRSVRIVPIFV
jgi:hypothetical protein